MQRVRYDFQLSRFGSRVWRRRFCFSQGTKGRRGSACCRRAGRGGGTMQSTRSASMRARRMLPSPDWLEDMLPLSVRRPSACAGLRRRRFRWLRLRKPILLSLSARVTSLGLGLRDGSGCAYRGAKDAASCHFIRGGWDDPNCARPTRAF